jgi:hypothetical protein
MTARAQSQSDNAERCRLCGTLDDLSFEHVPPKSAFNRDRAEMLGLDAWLEREKSTGRPGRRGTISQRGSGVRTLCRTCNSRAGRLYVPEMARWMRVGRYALRDNREAVDDADATVSTLGIGLKIKEVRPGRFVKQMVTMLLAIAPIGISDGYPSLAAYARDPDVTAFPDGMSLYLNFYLGPISRFIGSAAVVRESDRATYAVTELAYPPFAYALVMGEPIDAPALPYCDITSFAAAPIDRLANVEMFMQCGFGHTPFPLDYRSPASLAADRGA